MQIHLPLIVSLRGRRLYQAFVPQVPDSLRAGPSLATLRDELTLQVIHHCEESSAAQIAELSIAPHHALQTVQVDTTHLDERTRKRTHLRGAVSVLIERWPHDGFVLVTPTRVPDARFALAHTDDLRAALSLRLGRYCAERSLDDLSVFSPTEGERLEILEVSVDPPSALSSVQSIARWTERIDTAEARRKARLRAVTLRAVATDLSRLAADQSLSRAFGRDGLLDPLHTAMTASNRSAVVLVGPSGAGKTAIVHELALRLYELEKGAHDVPHLWRVDGQRFVSGMSFVGQWEARARELVKELETVGDVLYVDDLASLVFAGRTNQREVSVAQFLAEPLSRGAFALIAECTPEGLARVRQEAPSFARCFRVVNVDAMDERATVPVVLASARARLGAEAMASVAPRVLTPEGLEALLASTRRYFAHEVLPGAALRLLQTVLDDEELLREDVSKVGTREVLEVVGRRTGLPRFVLGLEPPRARERIVRELQRFVAGQPEALAAVTDAVLSVQSALSDPDKPVATLLFVGPTGVGKTETAKALARYLYGSSERLLRFDMSELSSPYALARLVGDASQPDGELTGALRAQPFRVVLFDEIEKAHPVVFDGLLRMLGEGKITDAAGRVADARGCVIVMTSNLGVREAAARTGFLRGDPDEARKHYVRAVEQFFRPEFFNRVDRVVPFRSLDPHALRAVLRNALGELLSRSGVRSSNVFVDVEPELLDQLVAQAFDPRFGARPLRRSLERSLAVPLAYHLVGRRGDDAALVYALRGDDRMVLAMRAMREAVRLPVAPLAQDESALRERFFTLCERLEALTDSQAALHAAQLRDRGLATLSAVGRSTGESRTAFALHERRMALHDTLQELTMDTLATDHFEETEIRGNTTRRDLARSSRTAHSTYVEVPVQQRERQTLERARPQVEAMWDELTLLEHQMHAFAQHGDERVVVVIEQLLPSGVEGLEWREIADILPTLSASTATWRESAAGWTRVSDERNGALPALRRVAVELEGPALRAMLAPYEGYALIQQTAASEITALLRITVEAGAMPEAAIGVTERFAREREVLRIEPQRAASWPAATLVLRTRNGRLEHVATGLAALAREAVVATWLRATR
ncbi:MAG: AAA family ATPase [Deltaproteobacteria bacterium]|nr:AAA family ATPase [Deltaproteobacteria bacterium]